MHPRLKAALLSLLVFLLLLAVWQLATQPVAGSGPAASTLTPEQIEYMKMLGKDPGGATQKSAGFPTPAQMGGTIVAQLRDPFYDNGPNDKGIAIQPKMLLLDEPFGALDALTRGTIQDELMAIVRQTQQTVFMITHDVDEAILLADRILLMSNGNETPAGYRPGGVAEVVVNPLPRERTRAGLHHLEGYYPLRNHIVDFLVGRARAT